MYFVYIALLLFSLIGIIYRINENSNKIIVPLWFFLFLMIGTYAYFSDDYLPYVNIVEDVYIHPNELTHIEPLWVWFAQLIHGDVNKFRLLTCILLAIAVYFTAKSTQQKDIKIFLFYYTILCLSSSVCWLRQPVAFFLFLFGVILAKRSLILAILLIAVSSLFHKSSLLLLLIFPFIFIPLSKRSITMLVMFTPVLVIVFNLATRFAEMRFGIPINWYLEQDAQYVGRNSVFKYLTISQSIMHLLLFSVVIKKYLVHRDTKHEYLHRSLLGTTFITFIFFLMMPGSTIVTRLISFGDLLTAVLLTDLVGNRALVKSKVLIFFIILLIVLLREMMVFANYYTKFELLLRLPI